MNKKIILLAGKGDSTNLIYHALKNEYDIVAIILEQPENKSHFLKRRIKKLGLLKVMGQVLFRFAIAVPLKLASAKRIKSILREHQLNNEELPGDKVIRVSSVNDNECLQILQRIDPAVVIVNGTRILSKSILGTIPVKFVNMHVGITPKYRGVHGGYWALVNTDKANCGVTIHLVDTGIDTGGIIYQQQIEISSKDNFVTYPLLQLAAGLPFLKTAIDDILQGKLTIMPGAGESRLWSHPTLGQYLYHRLLHRIK
jgi:folate-dependent phosphoribosylglycinamide formyltransferase PurN